MKCTSCGRRFKEELRRTRCPRCRDLAKVYTHQLHRRRGVGRFVGHSCPLCCKYRDHARSLNRRWTERGIYVLEQCRKHSGLWFRYSLRDRCPECQEEIHRKALGAIR